MIEIVLHTFMIVFQQQPDNWHVDIFALTYGVRDWSCTDMSDAEDRMTSAGHPHVRGAPSVEILCKLHF